jgi:hypothetical protein
MTVLLMCMAVTRRGRERSQGRAWHRPAISLAARPLTAPPAPATLRPAHEQLHSLTLDELPTGSKAVARWDSYNTISERNKLPILGTLSTDVAFACAKDMAMSTSTRPFSIVTFRDGSVAVVRSDPRTLRVLEVIAIFSEAERARDYADRENSRSAEPATEPTEAPTQRRFKSTAPTPELSARQSAVLGALRSTMDEHKQVAAKAVILAEAAQIPLGSLHSVLHSLEKKQLIKTDRAGSARAPAVYQVL